MARYKMELGVLRRRGGIVWSWMVRCGGGPLSSRLRRSTFPRGEGLGRGSINPKAGKLPMKGRKIGTEGRKDGR